MSTIKNVYYTQGQEIVFFDKGLYIWGVVLLSFVNSKCFIEVKISSN